MSLCFISRYFFPKFDCSNYKMCIERWRRLYVFYSTHPILVQRFIMLRQCQFKNFISKRELGVFSRTHALPPFLTSKKLSIKFNAFLYSITQPKGSHTWKKYQRDIILKVKKVKISIPRCYNSNFLIIGLNFLR